jgi:hypothetical protein
MVIVLAPLAWALLLGAAGGVIAARRRAQAGDPRGQVDLAWGDAREALTRERTPPRASETPAEYAHRAARVASLPEEPAVALKGLARLVEVSDYSRAEPDAGQAEEARLAADTVAGALGSGRPWWARALRRLDPRPVRRAIGDIRLR